MKWLRQNRDTSNFEDRRGMRMGTKGIAVGGVGTIVLAVLIGIITKDPFKVLQIIGRGETTTETVDESRRYENEDLKDFTLLVFNSCNDVWGELFSDNLDRTYTKPNLVVFTDQVQSACGGATAQVGPFYCPADAKVYIDLNFFHDLANKYHAPGELAMAYVTAHEMGHHVQNLLGLSDQLNMLRSRLPKEEFNKYSVMMELNADYLAGVWAHNAAKMGLIALEPGDLETALNAAEAIGDDTLQKQAQGYVVPEAFTHGTSRQRMKAFNEGYETGLFTGNELSFR